MVHNTPGGAHRFGRPDFVYRSVDGSDQRVEPVTESGPQSIKGRLAVITGGGGLLGSAMAVELLSRGVDVVLLGHDQDAMDELVGSLAPGARCLILRCDLADEADVVGAVDFLDRMDRPVDVLIHAAGLQTPSTIAWSSVKGLDEHYLWNVRGPYVLTQRLLPSLSTRSGRVVFFTAPSPNSASAADTGGDVHHRISSAGMETFARELRGEASRMGIRVLTVNAIPRTWNDMTAAMSRPDGTDLLDSLAHAVVEALIADHVEVSSLTVCSPSGTEGAWRR